MYFFAFVRSIWNVAQYNSNVCLLIRLNAHLTWDWEKGKWCCFSCNLQIFFGFKYDGVRAHSILTIVLKSNYKFKRNNKYANTYVFKRYSDLLSHKPTHNFHVILFGCDKKNKYQINIKTLNWIDWAQSNIHRDRTETQLLKHIQVSQSINFEQYSQLSF